MKRLPITITFYRTRNGKEPFAEWIDSLKDARVAALIQTRIGRVRLGNFGDFKAVGRRVYELRIHISPGYRVYFGRIEDEIVLLLCGGTKGNQRKDILKAYEYFDDYKEASREGTETDVQDV